MNRPEVNHKDITLTLTERCNLDCVYCYEKSKTVRDMDFEVARSIVERELTSKDETKTVTIELFGGEPLLCFEVVKKLCEWTWRRSWPKDYIFFATTNGTKVHGELKEWFRENRNKFWLGLSYDGTPEMQDENRGGSSREIDLDFFADCWPDQGVKMTISQETLPSLADGVIYLHRKGFNVSCNLAFDAGWDAESARDILSEQLEILSDYYIEHPGIKPCSMLDYKITGVLYDNEEFEKWCGAGESMRFYSVEGKHYPCQFFQPLSVGSEAAEACSVDFSDRDALIDSMCRECPFLTICPTCYGANYAANGDPAKKSRHECELNKVVILANSWFRFRQLESFSNDELGIDDAERRRLIEAVVAIQEAWMRIGLQDDEREHDEEGV